MRQIGDLMKEMGFNPDSNEETQKAFIKHLIRAANIQEWDQIKKQDKVNIISQIQSEKESSKGEQLSFNFSEIENKGVG